ncbi:hypothetical protein BT93_H1790 [Corymbia citriodora subsp. variegata]|nr:hypothetical protein BT93_H1790 [Corymbia citriodora subsp. variegata]
MSLLHQSLVHPTVSEHQSKLNSLAIPANTFFKTASANQAATKTRTPKLCTKFSGTSLKQRKAKLTMGGGRAYSFVARAVLTTDPAPELAGKFKLDGDIELKVEVSAPVPGSTTQVEFHVASSSDTLILHWGAVCDKKEKWILPSRYPDGTKEYKKRALRTPFVKLGEKSFLKIEIDDPSIKAVEFLILDEAQNKWYKNNGENFHVKFPLREKIPNVPIPEDLVQIQAYLRWERKGKQMYTPEQEKEEYEAARFELLEEVARGTSIEDLRAKITKKSDENKTEKRSPPEQKSKIPDELVQVQAYIRWEKAGKPNYSADQQLREFEEARKELQAELEKGCTVEDIRKKICKGEIESKVSKQLQKKKYFHVEKIQRKRRDVMQLINKSRAKSEEGNIPVEYEPKTLTTVELFAKALEERDLGRPLTKRFYKIGDKELLVLVSKLDGKMKVHFATDLNEPVTLHWALSRKNAGEWLAPPPSILPPGSVSQHGATETQFSNISPQNPPYQVQRVEIELEDESFIGMPFVLRAGGNWIKDKGSDFYIQFVTESKQVQKAISNIGDGKGTAKGLLDKIATMESEAQKSFMHRFNIAADLTDQAQDAGELGLAGILVWMRFMATRQLIWNKNTM